MGWAEGALGTVCDVRLGGPAQRVSPEHRGGGIPWVTPRDLARDGAWVVTRTARSLEDESAKHLGNGLLPAGSVLLSAAGRIGLIAIAGTHVVAGPGVLGFVCGDAIDSWYLFAWFRLRRSWLRSLGQGPLRSLLVADVKDVRLPIPPMERQSDFREAARRLQEARRRAGVVGDHLTDLARWFPEPRGAASREAGAPVLNEEASARSAALCGDTP
ncbi:MAG: restriction endonuclease subunit S [Acidobacteriota bacterium]|nr:restriction endonuclease subunit S [Acidobacteriota bacterium]